MSDQSKSFIFVRSTLDGDRSHAEGQPVGASWAATVDGLGAVGFQATNVGRAAAVCTELLKGRVVGETAEKTREAAELAAEQCTGTADGEGDATRVTEPATIFVGATANLFATGVRDALCYLCRHSLIDVLVVSGGGVEHDIRRECGGDYRLVRTRNDQHSSLEAEGEEGQEGRGLCGNVSYLREPTDFKQVLQAAVRTIAEEQDQRRRAQSLPPAEARRIDADVIAAWHVTPSELWSRVGAMLPALIGQGRAERCVAYWAAVNGIPIFSPSISDGDLLPLLQPFPLRLDLVRDISALNRRAIRARATGMLILGGGVVKHHVCNANLFRNGAEHAVYINTAQEFDGSDGGARPDEAVSWGKIKAGAAPVKVYAEITSVFPLLVAQVFAPFVHAHQQRSPKVE